MKLYATTTSERASKGQGGNKYVEVHLSANKKTLINAYVKQTAEDMFELEIFSSDMKRIYHNVYSIPDRTKGNKQKGDCEIYGCSDKGHKCIPF